MTTEAYNSSKQGIVVAAKVYIYMNAFCHASHLNTVCNYCGIVRFRVAGKRSL